MKYFVVFGGMIALLMASGCKSGDTGDAGIDAGRVDAGFTPCDAGCPEEKMVTIPAGDFWMGCDPQKDKHCQSDEMPYHKVYLSEYKIDIYEVVKKDYQKCIDSGNCSKPVSEITPDGWDKLTDDQPAQYLTWPEAYRYCAWRNARLPTEAEWEKAARGTEGNLYPWGDSPAPSCKYANISDLPDVFGCGTGNTMPPGSKPLGKSPYGLEDTIGNMDEWVADWYAEDYYGKSPDKDPKGPEDGKAKVRRGFCYSSYNSGLMKSYYRYSLAPNEYGAVPGVRCAKQVP